MVWLTAMCRSSEARSCPVVPRGVCHRCALVSWRHSLCIPLRSAIQLSRYIEEFPFTLQRGSQNNFATGTKKKFFPSYFSTGFPKRFFKRSCEEFLDYLQIAILFVEKASHCKMWWKLGEIPFNPLPHVLGVKNDNIFSRSQNVYIYRRWSCLNPSIN